MYIVKNAFKNIKNSPLRSLILIVIITVVSMICCMSLALLRISDKAEKEAIAKLSVTAKVTKGNLADSIDASSDLTYDEINRFAASEYVQDSYISAQTNIALEGDPGEFVLVGYNSEMAAEYFLVVDEIVIDGILFDLSSPSKECIITETLSKSHDLKVGEIVLLKAGSQIHDFEITGLYEGNGINENNILVSLKAFELLIDIDDDIKVGSAFVFNNPDYIDPFKKYVAQSSTDEVEYKAFFSGVQKFREYFSPIKSTKNFAVLSLILSLFVGGSILIVLSIFNIQERKYEVGVLSAIGMPKKKVVSQFVIEIFAVTLFSMILGIAAGAPLSIGTAKSMLSPTMYTGLTYTLRVTAGVQGRSFGYTPDANSDKDLVAVMSAESRTVDKLKAVMDVGIILRVIAIGLLLTIIASLGSIIFVVKFKPLDILNDRN